MKNLEPLQEKLGHTFADEKILVTALTHRSYINESHAHTGQHNERLEFLGDAVLELISTEFLFAKYPKKTEGDLTSYRAGLVNTSTLATVAMELGVNDFLLLSKGEAKDIGRARQYILANAFEALVGALFLDGGYAVAQQFVQRALLPLTDDIVNKHLWRDAKSRFQELAQDKTGVTPSYETLNEEGPDHDKKFTVGVFLKDVQIAHGDGKSKQEAEQEAAQNALTAKGWAR
ncbi:ribonuclease III [Candidatus Campbellbacteria bacterium]|nr:MAG: ribonuclease III [Candidatus Campbellbacteria bacterium]